MSKAEGTNTASTNNAISKTKDIIVPLMAMSKQQAVQEAVRLALMDGNLPFYVDELLLSELAGLEATNTSCLAAPNAITPTPEAGIKYYTVRNWFHRRPYPNQTICFKAQVEGPNIIVRDYETDKVSCVYPIPRLEFHLYHYMYPKAVQEVLDKHNQDSDGGSLHIEDLVPIAPHLLALPHELEHFAQLWDTTCRYDYHKGYYKRVARVIARNLTEAASLTTNHRYQEEWGLWAEDWRVSLTPFAQELFKQNHSLRSTTNGDVFVLPVAPSDIAQSEKDGDCSCFPDDLTFMVVDEATFCRLSDCTLISDLEAMFPSCYPAIALVPLIPNPNSTSI
jgi:hypothetical protein